MDRILALQGLASFVDADPVAAGSGDSIGCSSDSSGAAGKSTCSVGCGGAQEMEW
jgi:hypothetical protein